MERVISSAEALCSDEVPVYAAVAVGARIISTASNKVECEQKPWLHAEFLAISEACKLLQAKYLDSASIYVTLEPCAFCAAMLEKVRVREIFFGAYDPKCGAIEHGVRLFDNSMIKPVIVGGIQEERCAKIMQNFFKKVRRQ